LVRQHTGILRHIVCLSVGAKSRQRCPEDRPSVAVDQLAKRREVSPAGAGDEVGVGHTSSRHREPIRGWNRLNWSFGHLVIWSSGHLAVGIWREAPEPPNDQMTK
jgi:hypothetical protein